MSALTILKFGGSAFKAFEDYQRIAHLITTTYPKDHPLLIVTSAQHNVTSQLIDDVYRVNPQPTPREKAMYISTGDRQSASLLALALAAQERLAQSFTGSQAGIITTEDADAARILDVQGHRLTHALGQGIIPIVAGFQGIGINKNITTLGRGGSDITAVALALAFHAPSVLFYKDVTGVFDPYPPKTDQQPLAQLCYKHAHALTQKNHPFLHPRCLHLAASNGLTLHIRSHLAPHNRGTTIYPSHPLSTTPGFEVNASYNLP